MPCYDERSTAAYAYKESQVEIDRLTDMLCRAGRSFAAGVEPPKDVIEWWLDHSEKDGDRGEPWTWVKR